MENQRRIKELAEKYGAGGLIVVLGAADPDCAELAALTVTSGDPTYAGPLSGVQLGLPVYHIMESEIKQQVDGQVYEEQVSMMELVVEVEKIIASVKQVRKQHSRIS